MLKHDNSIEKSLMKKKTKGSNSGSYQSQRATSQKKKNQMPVSYSKMEANPLHSVSLPRMVLTQFHCHCSKSSPKHYSEVVLSLLYLII